MILYLIRENSQSFHLVGPNSEFDDANFSSKLVSLGGTLESRGKNIVYSFPMAKEFLLEDFLLANNKVYYNGVHRITINNRREGGATVRGDIGELKDGIIYLLPSGELLQKLSFENMGPGLRNYPEDGGKGAAYLLTDEKAPIFLEDLRKRKIAHTDNYRSYGMGMILMHLGDDEILLEGPKLSFSGEMVADLKEMEGNEFKYAEGNSRSFKFPNNKEKQIRNYLRDNKIVYYDSLPPISVDRYEEGTIMRGNIFDPEAREIIGGFGSYKINPEGSNRPGFYTAYEEGLQNADQLKAAGIKVIYDESWREPLFLRGMSPKKPTPRETSPPVKVHLVEQKTIILDVEELRDLLTKLGKLASNMKDFSENLREEENRDDLADKVTIMVKQLSEINKNFKESHKEI